MFRDLADEGRSVILITHDIDLAFDFADRVAVFCGGRAPGAPLWAGAFYGRPPDGPPS